MIQSVIFALYTLMPCYDHIFLEINKKNICKIQVLLQASVYNFIIHNVSYISLAP